MDFEKQVKEELIGLTEGQQTEFAWHCAVRALPFLGSNGHFDFWTNRNKRYHLNNVFFALDITVYLHLTGSLSDKGSKIVTRIDEMATNAIKHAYLPTLKELEDDIDVDLNTNLKAYLDASYALNTIVNAFRAVLSSRPIKSAYLTAIAAQNTNNNLAPIILEEINQINNNNKPAITSKSYDEVWENFQQALKNEGCEYWGKLYQDIFDKNFEYDWDELERRVNVPGEIRRKGAAAVGKYLEELAKGAKRLNEARIIILGEKGSGKTCIARKLKDPNAEMTTPEESTPGVDTSLWKLKDDNINVRIWDFAGHTVTHAVHQFFLSERSLYILVYDSRTEMRNRLDYWLDHMENYGGNSEAIILVNKRDKHKIEIPINTLKENYRIAGLYFFDIGTETKKLQRFREVVARYINNNPSWEKQQIPESYYKVKDNLEKLFNKKEKQQGTEHISKTKFLEIARKHKVDDPENLLIDLHFLGISLWYNDMEKYDTLVLNPEWISEGVYKIINWVHNESSHDITLECFAEVFKKDRKRFPKSKDEFLFDLIKHYELAYETAQGKQLIIPHLLKEDQPVRLPEFHLATSLKMKYEANRILPPNTISRFIVRHNEQIKRENDHFLIWKYGVILQDGKGSEAMVREVDRSINVSVKGTDRTNFISKIRDTLNDIFESYKSQRPELSYKVVDESKPRRQELWLPEQEIATLNKRNKPYYDYRTDTNIPMKPTVVNYNITHYHISVSGGEVGVIGGDGQIDRSMTFNFQNCNIELQANLNDLAQRLTKQGNQDDVEELKETANTLKEVKDVKDKEEIREKGIVNRLKHIVEDLGDEESGLHKAVKGIRNGVSIAQDIAKEYNKIAQWLALPQVPEPFLKNE